jgi:hypothetical protein
MSSFAQTPPSHGHLASAGSDPVSAIAFCSRGASD